LNIQGKCAAIPVVRLKEHEFSAKCPIRKTFLDDMVKIFNA